MSLALWLGSWVATVWIHSTILSLAAIALAYFTGPRHRELRDLAWKVALVGGIFTATLQFALPTVAWRDVTFTTETRPTTATASVDRAGEQTNARHVAIASQLSAPPSNIAAALLATKNQATDALTLTCLLLAAALAVGLAISLVQTAWAMVQLYRIRQRSITCREAPLVAALASASRQLGVQRPIELLESREIAAPLAMGVLRPCVLIPHSALDGRLDAGQIAGLLAHEVAHHRRGDPLWALVAHVVTTGWWFQPLHRLVRNAMRSESEYLADALACRTLGEGVGLARCLATMAEWIVPAQTNRVKIGTVHLIAFRSSLKQRVEALLDGTSLLPTLPRWRLQGRTAALASLALLILAAPAIHIRLPFPVASTPAPAASAAPSVPPALPQLTPAVASPTVVPQTAAEAELPSSVRGFSGELRGTVVSKDVDGNQLLLKVAAVTQVWKGNKAKRADDLVGKTVPIEKFFGPFLEVLRAARPGDDVVLEARHVSGEHLQFLGEVFKIVETPTPPPATKLAEPGFPPGLAGFRGIFIGKVLSIDTEKGVLKFTAESVKRTWPQSKAKDPASSQGRPLTVTGIRGEWSKVLTSLKPGDRIEVEAFHHQGETLDFPGEWLKKAE